MYTLLRLLFVFLIRCSQHPFVSLGWNFNYFVHLILIKTDLSKLAVLTIHIFEDLRLFFVSLSWVSSAVW
jgi:hypothetical protein